MSENVKAGRPVLLRRSRAPSWTQAVSMRTWLGVAVLTAMLLLVYWGEVRRLADQWTNLPDWTHGWLIPVMSLYIIHANRHRLWRIVPRPNLFGAIIMICAALLYLWSILHMFGYFRAVSILLMIAGVVLLVAGWRWALAMWFPISLLIFAIPLPSVKYTEVTFPLRKMVTVFSTGALNLLPGVHAQAEATVIDYVRTLASGQVVSGKLNVEEACSGMRLLMAFLAMGAIMAYLMREKPIWHRIVLLGLCVPIAIFCNFIRVTVTSLLQVYGYDTLAKGGAHAALGLLMMVLALGMFTGTNWMLSRLVTDGAEETTEPVAGEVTHE